MNYQWIKTSIGEIADIKHGWAFPGSGISEEVSDNVLVTPGSFKIGGGFKKDNKKFFNGDYPHEYLLHPDDLIVTMTDLSKNTDTLGFSALVPDDGKKYLHNQRIGLVQLKSNVIDKKYLYWLLRTYHYQRFIAGSASGTTVKHTSPTLIKKYCFLMPPLEKQKKIVGVLSSLDNKIELNAQINHNLEEQLYALYASNYDNLSGKKVPLKECCSFQEGYVNPTQTKPEYFDGSVKWLRAVDINESFIISTSRTLTEQGFASAGKSALLFPKDSIAISKSGTIGRLGIVADNMCGNRAVINIVPKQKKWLAFIYCYLKSRQAEFSDLAVGSVQKNLYVSILEPLEIFSPADSVLNDFHFSAQTILEKMKNNCFEMQSLAQLRDALLPKLMSGEIDVSEVEV